jgi:hypothetical protein
MSCTFVIKGRSQQVHIAYTLYTLTLWEVHFSPFFRVFSILCVWIFIPFSLSFKQTVFHHIFIFSFGFYVEQFLFIRGNLCKFLLYIVRTKDIFPKKPDFVYLGSVLDRHLYVVLDIKSAALKWKWSLTENVYKLVLVIWSLLTVIFCRWHCCHMMFFCHLPALAEREDLTSVSFYKWKNVICSSIFYHFEVWYAFLGLVNELLRHLKQHVIMEILFSDRSSNYLNIRHLQVSIA